MAVAGSRPSSPGVASHLAEMARYGRIVGTMGLANSRWQTGTAVLPRVSVMPQCRGKGMDPGMATMCRSQVQGGRKQGAADGGIRQPAISRSSRALSRARVGCRNGRVSFKGQGRTPSLREGVGGTAPMSRF